MDNIADDVPPTAEIYQALDVKRVINAADTYTLLGGGRLDSRVSEALVEASRHHVDVPALLDAVGKRIAELLKVEAALPVNGAAAALTIATAASITGTDSSRIGMLPETLDDKNEIVVLRCQRNSYDRAILAGGGRLVEVGYADSTPKWWVENVIGASTAAVIFYAGEQFERFALPLEEIAELCKYRGVPLIVDAAAQIPPVSNLWHYLDAGADLAVFSGGKGLKGPQSSGLIVGREDLIRACSMNSYPHHSVGRAMKTSKESVLGLLHAVENALQMDWDAEYRRWMRLLDGYSQELNRIDGLETWITPTGRLGQTCPRLFVDWSAIAPNVAAKELEEQLSSLNPAIAIGYDMPAMGRVFINPYSVTQEEERYLIRGFIGGLERVIAS